MLFTIIITSLLTTMRISQTEAIQTTAPISIILEGFTFQTWSEKSLWNKTRSSIVHHLNEFCRKDDHCDAEYGIGNIHLIDAASHGPTSIHLNITADKPVPTMNAKFGNVLPLYNYTALLTAALFQTKIDIERLYDHRSIYSSTYAHQNAFENRTSRLLFVFLGITLVGIIFGLTVFFFQRIRRHSYSKLLKPPPISQPTQDQLLTNSPSMSAMDH